MRTATLSPIKSRRTSISHIANQSGNENLTSTPSHMETAVKHYLLYNLDILFEVSKYEKIEGNLETAASIIREYEFLGLVNDSKTENVKFLINN